MHQFCVYVSRETYIKIIDPLEEKMRQSISAPTSNYQDSGEGSTSPEAKDVRNAIAFDDLEMRTTLGRGSFGRVKLVVHKTTGETYALKILQKSEVVAFGQENNIMNEKRVLQSVNHPFILKLYSTYKDGDRLYMLLELVQGGELYTRLQSDETQGRVPVKDARFYAACSVDALGYLHSKSIVYRDLKPENLLIDGDGYIKVSE